MGELLFCRVCLASDTRLYNMFKFQLTEAYEALSGFTMTESDGLPHQACSFCSTLLQKFMTFKLKCRNSNDLLRFALLQKHLLSTEYIRSIDRETLQLTLPYTKVTNITDCMTTTTDFTDNIIIKKEKEDNLLKYETELFDDTNTNSDDEPLSELSMKKDFNVIDKYEKNYNKDAGYTKIDETAEDVEADLDLEDIDNWYEIDVIYLTKEQQIEEIQARKNTDNYQTSCYKCDKCFKGYMTDVTFKNHMSRHDPQLSGSYECEICHIRWPKASKLRLHMSTHQRRYVCKLCNLSLKTSHRAKEHCKWHSGVTYICKICGASFEKSTSYLTHLRLQHPSENVCDVCGESFIGVNGLKMHRKKQHRHMLVQSFNETECCRCEQCGTQFRSLEVLNKHTDTPSKECDPNLRYCRECGQAFCTENEMIKHAKLHRKEAPFECTECNKTFVNERAYARHYKRMHLGVKWRARGDKRDGAGKSVMCEICGLNCISNATLVYHQRVHTGEKPYQCSECPKRFRVFQNLQIHLRTHTGERPYKCEHCPKAFKHKAAINRHIRVHTGVKPYECPHCSKSFSQSNSMKMHVRTVHLKLPTPYRHKRYKTNE